MGKLYTAFSVNQYSEVLRTKELPVQTLEGNVLGLEFTEDKSFWIEQLKNQEDLEDVADYKYAVVIEFEIKANVLNTMITSDATGRLSKKITQYYKELNKPMTLPTLKTGEVNILCVLDVYESDETQDGISQQWMLKVDSIESDLWKTFSEGVFKIICLGAIPGAIEKAKDLLPKPKTS